MPVEQLSVERTQELYTKYGKPFANGIMNAIESGAVNGFVRLTDDEYMYMVLGSEKIFISIRYNGEAV